MFLIGPILWGHSSPLSRALSLLLWTLIAIAIGRRRATVVTFGEWQCKTAARSGKWAHIFQMLLVISKSETTLYLIIKI